MIAGRYVPDRQIGRGGMGAVWLARDTLLDRPVAMKRIGIPPGGSNPEDARVEREARLAASLSHPNVVSVFDLAPDGETQWLVMEYVEGTDLAAMVADQGALEPDRAALVLAQVAAALVAAHQAGVVHRDVKPSNILVTPEGQVKLSDFGIARTKGDPSLTQTGLVTGSPAYLSPEVASGRSATDKSDVWSLGATAFHALEGRPPYELGDNVIGALYRIVHEPPPRPTSPGWLAPLFDGTLEPDEERRWDARQVTDFLAAGPQAAPAPRRARRTVSAGGGSRRTSDHTQLLATIGSSAETEEPSRSRTLALGLVSALVVVALLAGGLVLLFRSTQLGSDVATDPLPPVDSSAAASPSAPATSPSATAPTSGATAGPTKAGMEGFVRRYLATAPGGSREAFNQLTPAYQQRSGGITGYRSFWGPVRNVQVQRINADTTALTVTYRYSYRRYGPHDETITLALAYTDGSYLIEGAS